MPVVAHSLVPALIHSESRCPLTSGLVCLFFREVSMIDLSRILMSTSGAITEPKIPNCWLCMVLLIDFQPILWRIFFFKKADPNRP